MNINYHQFLVAVVLALTAGQVLFATEAASADSQPAISSGVQIDYNSRYVWRGIASSDGAVLQPSAWITRGNTSISVWGNQTLTREDSRQWNETDYTLSYVSPWRAATVETDLVRYTYQHQPGTPATTEATFKFTAPIGALRLFTTQNFDIDRYQGSVYSEYGVGRSWQLTRKYLADATATVGFGSSKFNAVYIGPDKAAADTLTIDFGISQKIGILTVRPHATYTRILDSSLRDSVKRPDITDLGLSVERDW